MPRRQRPLIRDADTVRDASLIVIASEDTHAPERYFERFRSQRVKVRVIPTEDGYSAPQHVFARLEQYRAEYQIGDGDELWYCGDTDRWVAGNHRANLNLVLSDCNQRGYGVALSNPCFELWLLLHFEDAPVEPLNCEAVCDRLRSIAGGYSKPVGCVAAITDAHVARAIARAEAADSSAGLPTHPCSQVHRILRSMAARQSLSLRSAETD